MQDQTHALRKRLQILLEQVERDRASMNSNSEAGKAAYSRLFDSLTATLHNLNRPAEAQKTR
jgi:hypothetical protein